MLYDVEFEDFAKAYRAGKPQILSHSLFDDALTPVSAFRKLTQGGVRFPFLLESVTGGERLGRYSIVGYAPDLIWRTARGRAWINAHALDDPEAGFQEAAKDPLASLSSLAHEARLDLPAHLPPMAAGLVGYFGYDSVRFIESIGHSGPAVLGLPDGIFVRPTVTAIFDNLKSMIHLNAIIRPDAKSAEQRWEQALQMLGTARDRLAGPMPAEKQASGNDRLEFQANMPKHAYLAMVRSALDYIHAGDVFQVVLSQRFSADYHADSFEFYRKLRSVNPSPFLFYLDFQDFQLCGSSPEILVRVRDGQVTIRPIAGTRPRGRCEAEDLALEQALRNDPKELSEHLMLLDLGRNDVGRFARPGSVQVSEQFTIERYSHVMHLVSNVTGRLREGATALDALFAGFPAGTVSGAPKVRAMQIINELEPEKREIFAGCIGYLGADGSLDTCIALRTAVLHQNKLHIQAGAGIVADSVPESEYQECHDKAKALMRAGCLSLMPKRHN